MNDNILDDVDKRTNLAFSNQMEMLTFFLTDEQQYGINVFKIIEVVETPEIITKMPQSHQAVVGAMDFRGRAISVIDLAMGLDMSPVEHAKGDVSYVIVCEYSNSTQGFLISHPNRLINKSWEEVKTPGGKYHQNAYLTAITYDGDTPIQILDIEKILGEIVGIDDEVPVELIKKSQKARLEKRRILVVDDSKAARTLLASTLNQMGIPHQLYENAEQAYKALEQSLQDGPEGRFNLIISDIEMPGMDGFTFTRKVKANPELADIHLVLHSSMSNQSNRLKAEQVGADGFIAKFQPQEVANMVLTELAN